MEVRRGMGLDEEKAKTLRELVQRGTFGVGVLETADCKTTVEELKARGVTIASKPQPRAAACTAAAAAFLLDRRFARS